MGQCPCMAGVALGAFKVPSKPSQSGTPWLSQFSASVVSGGAAVTVPSRAEGRFPPGLGGFHRSPSRSSSTSQELSSSLF